VVSHAQEIGWVLPSYGDTIVVEISYVTGDLLLSEGVRMIVHGCNAQGNMGSGIAKAIRDKWPSVYADYRRHYEDHIGENLMGQVVWSYVDQANLVVANAITQKHYGSRGKGVRYVSYDALATAFEEVNRVAGETEITMVGMPLIGADRGGGSWKVISAIIEATATNYRPIVHILDGKVPTT
jgi:O-acetyl-ADP-ribose deacetylase (regulator of RNase III)